MEKPECWKEFKELIEGLKDDKSNVLHHQCCSFLNSVLEYERIVRKKDVDSKLAPYSKDVTEIGDYVINLIKENL